MKMEISVLMVTFSAESSVGVAVVLDQQAIKIFQLFLCLQP